MDRWSSRLSLVDRGPVMLSTRVERSARCGDIEILENPDRPEVPRARNTFRGECRWRCARVSWHPFWLLIGVLLAACAPAPETKTAASEALTQQERRR